MKQIEPEKIKKGDYITVMSRKIRTTFEDKSWYGDPLLVKLVDLPFIAVAHVKGKYPIPLDVRELTLGMASKEYVDALTKTNTKEE